MEIIPEYWIAVAKAYQDSQLVWKRSLAGEKAYNSRRMASSRNFGHHTQYIIAIGAP